MGEILINKLEIIEKAFKVWHDGMLNDNPHEGYRFEELPITYGKTHGDAKTNSSEIYDFEIYGEIPEYCDIKAVRAKSYDVVLYNGEKIVRWKIKHRLEEEERVNKRRESVERFPDDSMFYIQNGYVGNAVLWWGLNSCGYVCDIHKAQAYSKEYVLKHFCDGREQDKIWEAKHVLNCIKEIVESQWLKKEYCS